MRMEIEFDRKRSESLDRIVESNLSLFECRAQLRLNRVCDVLRGDRTIESDAIGTDLGFDLDDRTIELSFECFGFGLNRARLLDRKSVV